MLQCFFNGHIISHLTIEDQSYLGLFGRLSNERRLFNLALEEVVVNGTGSYVGGLIGLNNGTVAQCYCTRAVSGDENVSGLIGENIREYWGHNSVFGMTYGEYGVVT